MYLYLNDELSQKNYFLYERCGEANFLALDIDLFLCVFYLSRRFKPLKLHENDKA